MVQKDLLALMLLAGATVGGIFLSTISQRLRTFFFVLMIPLSALTERVDVNFMSRDWYRGTTRGFEVSLVDVLSISLLVSALLAPRRAGDKAWFWPASLGGMLLYFALAAFCVGLADPKIFGLFELSKMLRGLIMFVAVGLFVRGERELRWLILGLGLAAVQQG